MAWGMPNWLSFLQRNSAWAISSRNHLLCPRPHQPRCPNARSSSGTQPSRSRSTASPSSPPLPLPSQTRSTSSLQVPQHNYGHPLAPSAASGQSVSASCLQSPSMGLIHGPPFSSYSQYQRPTPQIEYHPNSHLQERPSSSQPAGRQSQKALDHNFMLSSSSMMEGSAPHQAQHDHWASFALDQTPLLPSPSHSRPPTTLGYPPPPGGAVNAGPGIHGPSSMMNSFSTPRVHESPVPSPSHHSRQCSTSHYQYDPAATHRDTAHFTFSASR